MADANTFVARVPAGVVERQMLFDALRRELLLPAYFGDNWDALSDCLRDLSWIEQRRISILHDEVPAFDATTLSTYLVLLGECVESWQPDDDHELIVSFPLNAYDLIVGRFMDEM